MSKFNAQILTPEGSLYEGEVSGVKLPGTLGSFEVKANHAPIVSTLEKGEVLVRKATGGDTTFTISGGFVEVNNNKLTLLAESVEENG
ncbi:ATP synthase F1 subunit epsilon [Gracilimonas mengyeensis]|uniref:ATP synthase F1 subcomplex epsilon subunit n=1 Tax=Gracilimonas mengyeensis TaxID=1302730 RepID=A0A521D771_9BACT|nr:ATP synthase F1 subunit epsilon [Gracilimonas mengyeensis]SMO67556.1 ATP synthase F1 subcomplex epsilon subunit [Gracilimonas mengyeensis]